MLRKTALHDAILMLDWSNRAVMSAFQNAHSKCACQVIAIQSQSEAVFKRSVQYIKRICNSFILRGAVNSRSDIVQGSMNCTCNMIV